MSTNDDVFGYDTAVADDSHSNLGGVCGGLQSSLDDLGGFVVRVRANWDSDEMGLYDGIQHRWNGAASSVTTILQSVQGALGNTTSNVVSMNSQVRSAITRNA
jgi:hypothetical protein